MKTLHPKRKKIAICLRTMALTAIITVMLAPTALAADKQSCLDSCETDNVTLETGCKAACETAYTTVGLVTDPLGTIGGLFGSSGSEKTDISFTDFQGELEVPSTEGYSTGLVQATSARQYILNVTNFALGFLGLIAVLIIIYGGFLYVTAAGEEEKATKGKKSITYAVIGILLIMGSFAIVNTLLRAPSGTDEGTELSGAAPGEGMTVEEQAALRRALFNTAGTTVRTVATDFLTGYQNFAQARNAISVLDQMPTVNTSTDFDVLINSKIAILNSLNVSAGLFSEMKEVVPEKIAMLQSYRNESLAALSAANNSQTVWNETFWTAKKGEISGALLGMLMELHTSNQNDFAYIAAKARQDIAKLKERTGTAATLTEVAAAFTSVEQALDAVVSGTNDASARGWIALLIETAHAKATLVNTEISNTEVLRIMELMKTLHDVVQNIQFVYATITADVVEGNAPLIVNFDGLKSIDPGNQTLTDFSWDFGDSASAANNTATGVTTNHVFNQPGTYVVNLNVKSPTPDTVAEGLATIRITVKPPVTKIQLYSVIGGEQYDLRRYDEFGNLVADSRVMKVSTSEAAAGFTLDATNTAPSTAESDRIRSVRWSFGDNRSEVTGTGTQLALKLDDIKYEMPGTYQLVLEVTDVQNNVDRKIVNVVVATPVARFVSRPGTFGKVGQEFTFDGGNSTSDSGQITGWSWSVSNPADAEILTPVTSEIFKVKFINPGSHTVKLQITDSLGDTNDESVLISVESEPPVAQFKHEFTDLTQPGTVLLDGSMSYDPDGSSKLEYLWEVDGNITGAGWSFADGTNSKSEQPKIKFNQKGTYKVALTVTDPDGYGTGKAQDGQPTEKEITVNNVLDVAWGETDKTTGILQVDNATGDARADITLTLTSEKAVAYEIDFGDGEMETGSINKTASISHSYKEAGTFGVKASVFDIEDDENAVSRKVFIGSTDTPIAKAGILVNNNEILDTTGVITVSRQDVVTFDASSSVNVDGTGRRLRYSWDFGDGEKSTGERANHTYRDIGTYNASLKVTNENDVSQVSPVDKIIIEVKGQPPFLRSMTAVPTGTSLVAPVTVQLSALGAEDSDGRITRYRWWYYDPNNDQDQLGVQVTAGATATVTIGTRGAEGEEKTYKFAVELTDDENNTVSSRDILAQSVVPELTVTNGPNKAPVASFNVDRTTISVGESVNFTSASTDPDGQITAYFWDFEGDGFANNTTALGANVSHIFETPAPDGIKVKLKVRDNNESEATSDPVTIYIESMAEPPRADFSSEQASGTTKVTFTDKSTADVVNKLTIEKWSWDFDVNFDSNSDGKKDNDIDSTVQNPVFTYADYGIFRAKLTVTDSDGQTSSGTIFVQVRAAQTSTTATNVLGATVYDLLAVLVSILGFAILFLSLRKVIKER